MKATRLATTVAVVALLAAGATAATYSDSLASGPGQTVDFTGIGDNLGLYGGYNRSGDSMTWMPADFTATSSNRVAETTSDTLQMTITAREGDWLTSVDIFEIGDYAMSGPSDGFAQTQVSATLFVNEVAPSGGLAGYDSYSETFDLNIDPSTGLFTGSLFVDLTGMNITSVAISWQNNLQASSEEGTTAMIQKKYGELGISVDVIPEPATLGLLGIGGLLAVVRRRR